jgi:YbbR domain-containing protein
VRIKVDVPQKYYNQVSASNYNVRVDLSKIRSAGEQVLPVVATSSATYGTVTDISVSQVTVVVEEYVMRSKIPVRLETIGEAPAGFYGGAASVDPVYVAIAGPRSQVENVVRCVAQYDMAYLPAQNGTERTAVPFILYDRADQLVPQDDISVSTGGVLIDSITVEQTLFPINKVFVATAGLTAGTPEKGYEVKSISVEPAFVSIAFSYADTKRSEYIYPQDAIDLSGLKESTVVAVSLKRPSDTIYMSTDTVYVTVDIGPEGD